MVLTSQRQRRGGGGAYMRSKRRMRQRNRRIIAAVVGVVAIALLLQVILPGDDAATPESADIGAIRFAAPETDEPTRGAASVASAGIGVQPGERNESGQAATRPEAGEPAPEPRAVAEARIEPEPSTRVAVATPSPPAAAAITARGTVVAARSLRAEDRYVEARNMLNDALRVSTSAQEREQLRGELAELNDRMILSAEVFPNDPYTEWYVIQSGDALSKIAKRYQVTAEFLARINRLPNKNSIRAGARIKVVRGPFHALVDKGDFRLDVYVGDAPGAGLYVRSYRVGLGEAGSTPLGRFVVRQGSKLVNPEWVNPRTSTRVLADDPENPIGERWIGLEGIEADTQTLRGYGIHGTIEPQSIGREASMGCIRLNAGDVEALYDMLIGGVSRVTIQP